MQSDAISPLNLQPKGLKTIQLTGRALENKWYNRSHQAIEKKIKIIIYGLVPDIIWTLLKCL